MRNFKKAQASRPRSQGHRAPGGSGEPPERLGTRGDTGRPNGRRRREPTA